MPKTTHANLDHITMIPSAMQSAPLTTTPTPGRSTTTDTIRMHIPHMAVALSRTVASPPATLVLSHTPCQAKATIPLVTPTTQRPSSAIESAEGALIVAPPTPPRGGDPISAQEKWSVRFPLYTTHLMRFQLCNKCGLFERTHGRSRPDQFPHRRGPLATSTITRPKTPPQSTQLPPISTHIPPLAPYHYSHPSIAPLSSIPDSRKQQHPNQLPEIQSWIDAPTPRSSAMSSYPSSSSDHRGHGHGHDHLMPLRPRSPPRLQHHVNMRSSSVHEAVA